MTLLLALAALLLSAAAYGAVLARPRREAGLAPVVELATIRRRPAVFRDGSSRWPVPGSEPGTDRRGLTLCPHPASTSTRAGRASSQPVSTSALAPLAAAVPRRSPFAAPLIRSSRIALPDSGEDFTIAFSDNATEGEPDALLLPSDATLQLAFPYGA